jgi:hypothetical protein
VPLGCATTDEDWLEVDPARYSIKHVLEQHAGLRLSDILQDQPEFSDPLGIEAEDLALAATTADRGT